jgi:hypothetical protein
MVVSVEATCGASASWCTEPVAGPELRWLVGLVSDARQGVVDETPCFASNRCALSGPWLFERPYSMVNFDDGLIEC